MRKEIERSFFKHNLIAQSLSVKYAHILESQFDHQVVIKECVRIWWLFDGSYLMANWWIKLWLKHVRIFDGYLMGQLDLSFSVGSVIFSWICHFQLDLTCFHHKLTLQICAHSSITTWSLNLFPNSLFTFLSVLSPHFSRRMHIHACVSLLSKNIYMTHPTENTTPPTSTESRNVCMHTYIYIYAQNTCMHACIHKYTPYI